VADQENLNEADAGGASAGTDRTAVSSWRRVLALDLGQRARVRFAAVGSILGLGIVAFAIASHDIDAELGIAVGNALLLFVAVALIEHASRTGEAVRALDRRVSDVRADLDSVLAERDSPIVATYARVDDVPWDRLFGAATGIEIVARFCDDLIANRRKILKDFFETRTNRATLITLDPSDDAALESAMRERDPTGDFYDLEYMRRRVGNSARSINAAHRAAQADEDQLRVLYAKSLNYAGYCFSRRDLIITSYPQFYDQTARMPYVHVDLTRSPDFSGFWQNDLERLTTLLDAVPLASLSAPETG
jgi:hypothetical protein